jgi:hypothetical protein
MTWPTNDQKGDIVMFRKEDVRFPAGGRNAPLSGELREEVKKEGNAITTAKTGEMICK